MTIAILALQGAFAEHQAMLERLGAETRLIRNLRDWEHSADALVIPGGESTAILKIMNDLGLYKPIRDAIQNGLPVFGTCAGLIMLDAQHLGTMDIVVRRNAYGRQLGSFSVNHDVKGIGSVPMVFIRAPYIEKVGENVSVLSQLDGHIVAARQDNQFVCSFHPELTDDTRIHQYFLDIVRAR